MEIQIDTVNLKSLNISGVLASYHPHCVHYLWLTLMPMEISFNVSFILSFTVSNEWISINQPNLASNKARTKANALPRAAAISLTVSMTNSFQCTKTFSVKPVSFSSSWNTVVFFSLLSLQKWRRSISTLFTNIKSKLQPRIWPVIIVVVCINNIFFNFKCIWNSVLSCDV